MVPLGYTPSTSLNIIRPVSETAKYDVTFSLSHHNERTDLFGVADEADIIEMIRHRLIRSGAFASVRYTPLNSMSAYHIHFKMRVSGATPSDSFGVGLLAGYTLLCVPTWETFAIDLSALVYVDGKPVHSVATAEAERFFIWLPLAPVGLVWNSWLAWWSEESNTINFIINDITEQRCNAIVK